MVFGNPDVDEVVQYAPSWCEGHQRTPLDSIFSPWDHNSRSVPSATIHRDTVRRPLSIYLYQFTRSCGPGYLRRMGERMIKKFQEPHPAWLRKRITKTTRGSIIDHHLINAGQSVDVENPFTVIFRTPGNRPNLIKNVLLFVGELITLKFSILNCTNETIV